MPSIVVDSSILYAAFDVTDRNHQRAALFLAQSGAELVANLPVLTEVSHLLRKSRDTQRGFLNFCMDALEIDRDTASDLPRIVEVMEKYADLPADLADASLIALSERRQIASIATFDSDFEIYRLANGRMLRNYFSLS